MKVGAPAFTPFLNSIREKREADADDGGNSARDQGGGAAQEQAKQEARGAEDEAHETPDAGQRPGLRIQHLTGEDFLRIRQATKAVIIKPKKA